MSSQAGSSDVSKKLKAAIRAKLEELGVYVDDELPDYIMVMIANKKEKSQMKDDLTLFIGKSTSKFVDWLFDLFDRLQSASSKQGESSKKEEEKKKEEQKHQEDRHREEKHQIEKEEREKEQQREKEKERERERERQRERDREKRQDEERRREEKKREAQKAQRRRTRSRSNTYSDDESNLRHREKERRPRDHRGRSAERKRVASSVVRPPSNSPEPQKIQSTVTVKRNIRPSGDTNVKGRGTMFLKALNEASVSAGYGRHPKRVSDSKEEPEDDDMSDVEALPTKAANKSPPKKSIRERMSRLPKAVEDDDSVFVHNQQQTGGPQMIIKLTGGKEAIKRTRIQDRIVVDDSLRRGLLKRKMEATEEPKSKHERIKFDIETPISRDSTPTDDSPTMQKWNGHIKLGDDSDSSDGEAEIDAVLAETRGIARRESVREEEEELPPTHQLSGKMFAVHVNQNYQQTVPTYIPTPLSVLQEQQNQLLVGAVKEDSHVRERCVFWPKCTKGDACQFMHPAKNCTNFPNCSYGNRCLFIHPPCRFDRFCQKKHCPFTHHGTGGVQPGQAPSIDNPLTSNRIPATRPIDTMNFDSLPKPATRGALGSLAEKLAASLKKKTVEKKEEKTDENEKEAVSTSVVKHAPVSSEPAELTEKPSVKPLPEIGPLQNLIPCRYAGGCRNPVCHFKHPKECRFGANCRNPSCYFYHKPAAKPAPIVPTMVEGVTAKYKWTATSQ